MSRLNFKIESHRELRARLMREADFTCAGCGFHPYDPPEDYDGSFAIAGWGCGMDGEFCRQLQVDHLFPLIRGGGREFENLQVLCEPCNQTKGNGVWLGVWYPERYREAVRVACEPEVQRQLARLQASAAA